jgi:hypothetical protein
MKKLKIENNYSNYLTLLSGISKITKKEKEVLESIKTLNIDVLDNSNKKDLSNAINILPKTLNSMIKTMYKKKILVKKGHGIYIVNTILKDVDNLIIEFV